jgi:hypothetical protein
VSPQTPKRGLGEYLAAQRQQRGQEGELDGPGDVVPMVRAEPAQRPVKALAPAPAAPARKAPRRRRRAVPPADVWDRIQAMHDSAQTRPGEWDRHSLRLPVALDQRVAACVVKHRARTGNRQLSKNHFYAAALSVIPADIARALEWGLEWQRAHGIGKTLSRGSGTNLPLDLIPALDALTDRLSLLIDVKVPVWQVHARAIERLLDDLDGSADQEGPPGGDGNGGRPGGAGSTTG